MGIALSCRRPGSGWIFLLIILALTAASCGKKAKIPPPGTAQAPAAPAPAEPSSLPAPAPVAERPSIPAPPPVAITPAPARPAPAPSRPEGPLSPSPMIRIGLSTAAREVRISSPGEFHLVEKIPEAARTSIRGEVRVRVEQAGSAPEERYRVQVASLSRAESAEELRSRLAERLSAPAFVRRSETPGMFQVRVGDFATREEAQNFAEGPLARAGYPDAFVVRDVSATGAGPARLTLHGPRDFFRVSSAGFLLLPGAQGDHLLLDGKAYRGVFDLTLNRAGRITVVNELPMEEYLFGVVPAEMSPTTYPEPAALRAQAVAARTYALKNRGRFRSEGFDLTADQRTQVYGGVASERPMTSDAVRDTHGVAVYFEGNLIEAMYASTCGGRTEDFANVYDARDVPYLRGVVCTVEQDGEAPAGTVLQGKNSLAESLFADDGGIVNRNVELATVLGLVTQRPAAEALEAEASEQELRSWLRVAVSLADRTVGRADSFSGDLNLRSGFLRHAAEQFFGSGELERRISTTDASYFIGNIRDGAEVPARDRRALALLMQLGLWRPYPDNSARPGEPVRRKDAISWLVRLIEHAKPDILRRGQFNPSNPSSAEANPAGGISVRWGNRTQEFPLDPDLRLFRVSEGRSIPADRLQLIGNEKLALHVASNGSVRFLEVELNPTGASSDRYSPVASWQATLTRTVIHEKLQPLAPSIGEIWDLKPHRLGSSGRAVQMEAIGSRGSAVLNGYRVRNALGLRDTLLTISRTRAPDGSIESFTFDGRGWGHGIGLCQVGAFGMARAGLSFEEILRTYYRGIEIGKAY